MKSGIKYNLFCNFQQLLPMAILHYMGAGLGTFKQSEAIEASIIKFYNIQLRFYFINVDLRAELQYCEAQARVRQGPAREGPLAEMR